MKIYIKFFGVLKAETGIDAFEVNMDATGATVAVALKDIAAQFSQLVPRLDSLAFAVNHEFVNADYVLTDGDELALLPPVSGGSGKVVRITESPLKIDDLIIETEDHSSGALIVFSGVVRNHNDGQSVESITYEADVSLAVKVLTAIESEARSKYSIHHCRIQHRVGSLKLGELSIIIVVRSPHRAEAYEASRYAIEALKQKAPIWKQEHYVGGESRYLEGTPLKKGSTL